MLRTIARQGSIAAVLVLVTASAALASTGGAKSSSSSISLQLLTAPTTAGSTDPNYGQNVTFKIATNATAYPVVELDCYQGGTLVGQGRISWWVDPANNWFTLASSVWTGGAADCTAYLENRDSYAKNGRIVILASTSFHVNA